MTEPKKDKIPLEELTPKEIVKQLDTYIVGQHKAKKSVAIALRNRTRRLKLPEEIRDEIAPKNILMIGPTGVGKTEIARRLAKLCGAPFLKVEATKYTEVGYVGRDVESMIRDLMAVGYNMVKAEFQEKLKAKAAEKVEEALLDLLLPGSGEKKTKKKAPETDGEIKQISDISVALGNIFENAEKQQAQDVAAEESGSSKENSSMNETREKFRAMLRDGKLEDRQVEISQRRQARMPSFEIFAGGNMEDMESAMQGIATMISGSSGGSRRRSVSVKEAREILMEDQLDRMTDPDKVADEAKNRVQQMGIVFIDEIDKIATGGGTSRSGQDVSREGVQRDILPIVEGSNVNTKFGVIDTTHILFIAAGAFNVSKPSDLIPELQGRFPLRVELDSLNADDFKKILTEPKNALTKQYVSLLETEGVTINFTDEAIERMSSLAADVNARVENIGARRLHTIMETLLEDLSFEADEHKGETIDITPDYVDERLKGVVQDQDLSKYIL
ncbi:MAG: ATP-dependent protease ATPase subunit HslU [Spirochaetaceae bacterium]|nr:ATP-dependent protease ATPase subunit HslU [Spirochaetaceae bacterium]MBO4706435.1 ATP-dependent protease ATPase subunit HslU [Spirochaetaceae bacterium]